jgi:signal transduction histidine kinase
MAARRLSLTTWLPLLVLVPTLALGWLGYRAIDGFDAAVDRQIQVDLDRAEQNARRVLAAKCARIEEEGHAALLAAADRLALRAPDVGLHEAMRDLRTRYSMIGVRMDEVHAGNPVRVDFRLYDNRGRGLDPAEYVPVDQRGGTDAEAAEALLDALREEATKREAEGEDPEQVWIDAQARTTDARWRLAFELERVSMRASRPGAAAEKLRERAGALYGQLETHAGDLVGRRLLLLFHQLALARTVYDAVQQGYLDRVPLTDEERGRLIAMGRRGEQQVTQGVTTNSPLSLRVWPLHGKYVGTRPAPLRWPRATLPGGAQLEMIMDAHFLSSAVLHHVLQDAQLAGEIGPVGTDIRMAGGHAIAPAEGDRDWTQATVLGRPAVVRLYHLDSHLQAGQRAARRLVLTLTVAGLLGVSLLGLWLVRRAALRERDARRLRDDFIANVTHEVRTPLASVMLHAEMLGEPGLDDEGRGRAIDVVKAEGARLGGLVEDMLDFSALEAGTRALEPEPVDLGEAARKSVAPYVVLAEREGVALALEAGDGVVEALADPAALSRILSNLLANAWKHGRPSRSGGAGALEVRVGEDARGTYVDVADDGPGIPAADRARIFDRFGQGRATAPSTGAGLGLALARELARAQGGDLELRDEPERTVFRLRLAPIPDLNP